MNYDIIASDIQNYIENCKAFTEFNMGKEYSPLVEEKVLEKDLYPTDQFIYLAKEADDIIKGKDFERGVNTYYRNFNGKLVGDFIYVKFDYFTNSVRKDDPKQGPGLRKLEKNIKFNCIPYVYKIYFDEWPFDNDIGRYGKATLGVTGLLIDLDIEGKIREVLKDTPILEELTHIDEVIFEIEQNILYGPVRRKSSILESNLSILTQFFDEKGRFKEGFNPDPIDLREVEIQ